MKTEEFAGEINAGGGNYLYKSGETPVIPEITYAVSLNDSEGGSLSADPTSAPAGTEITLTVTPEDGYHFKEWKTDSGNITIEDNKFVMPYGDVSITAVFEKHHGAAALCNAAAVCDVCGEEYGDINPANHANLVKVEAKPATRSQEGNTEYWYCDGCDKYFSDEAGTKEIALKDTVVPKLTGSTTDNQSTTGQNTDDKSKKSPATSYDGETGIAVAAAVVLISLSALATIGVCKRKKHSAE